MLARIALAALSSLTLASSAAARDGPIQGLHADGPYRPQAAQMMAAFGRLIGDWDLVIEHRQEDGSWQRTTGEWHFGWILQGRAIQDVWIAYRPGVARSAPDALLGYGTTIRVYDAGADRWHVNWMGVLNHNYTLFTARVEGAEIVMEATDDDGHPFQWIFSEISESGFRWRAQTSTDNRATWTVAQRMTAGRSAGDRGKE